MAALGISGLIALVLLFMHRHFTKVSGSSDVFSGIASAMFWLLFAGAGWFVSSGDATNIYFYCFLFGIGMMVATLVATLAWKPTQETNQEKKEEQSGTYLENLRKRMGHRPLSK